MVGAKSGSSRGVWNTKHLSTTVELHYKVAIYQQVHVMVLIFSTGIHDVVVLVLSLVVVVVACCVRPAGSGRRVPPAGSGHNKLGAFSIYAYGPLVDNHVSKSSHAQR